VAWPLKFVCAVPKNWDSQPRWALGQSMLANTGMAQQKRKASGRRGTAKEGAGMRRKSRVGKLKNSSSTAHPSPLSSYCAASDCCQLHPQLHPCLQYARVPSPQESLLSFYTRRFHFHFYAIFFHARHTVAVSLSESQISEKYF
jgi:hypothetical protein